MKPITESGARALISLLLDEDPTTATVARSKLVEAGAAVRPYLEVAARSDDPRLRVRIRPLIETIRLDELESRLANLPIGHDGEIDLTHEPITPPWPDPGARRRSGSVSEMTFDGSRRVMQR